MLALGAVIAAEKNLPAGRRLAAPIGAVLAARSVWVALAGATA
jgi:predicted metal-binding membrane protein